MLNMKSNESLAVGAIVSLLVGLIISFLMGIIIGYPVAFVEKFLLGLIFGGLYFYWCTGFWVGFLVPTANHGVVRFFGTKRIPAGPNNAGLEEGPNWLPFGPPVFTVKNEDTQDEKVFIEDCTVRTKDNVDFKVGGFLMVRKERPDIFLGIQDARGSIEGFSQQALRDTGKKLTALELGVANKKDLSDQVENDLRELLKDYCDAGNERGLGYYLLDLQISKVEPPEDLQTAWRQPAIQVAQGEAENYKAARRKEQAKNFIDLKVDPNTALAAAMVNAQEPGARMTNVAIEGLDEIGKGIGEGGSGLGKGLGEGLGKIGDAIRAFAEELSGDRT